jgi:hypothetical protein
MSPDLPELPSTHVRPAPVAEPVVLDNGAVERVAPAARSEQEVRAINAAFADGTHQDVGSALFALWGVGVILDGLIEDAKGEHAAGEPEEEEQKPKQ